ncbi:MAG: hypothetical protein PHD53_09025, partial [Methylococcales bacterium]|nr:hypothetical protein [Methylococcales bacterium]
MITVTASPINAFTPVVDGAGTTTLPIVEGAASPEGFSTALTTQLNSLVQPTTNVAMLTTPVTSTMLAAISTPPTTMVTVPLTESVPVAVQVITPSTLSPTVSTTNASSTNPATIGSVAVAAMSAADTAILSTVTDTLKFITSGSKLGDTLQTGQSVQLPAANSATELTQQSMQSAIKQAAANTQVNTPARVLVQQIVPVQLVQTPVVVSPAVATSQPSMVPVLTQTASALQSPISAQAQIVATPQIVANETPVTSAQTQTVVTPQIAINGTLVTPTPAQTVATPQIAANGTPITPAPVQTLVTPQIAVNGTPVQTQTVATPQIAVNGTP